MCREVFNVIFNRHPLRSSDLCTQMLRDGNAGKVCNADSGGPAVFTNEAGVQTVVGVLAWGLAPCSNPSIPAVWGGIAPVREWIDLEMWNNSV